MHPYSDFGLIIRRAENGFIAEESSPGDAPGKRWAFESPASIRDFVHQWAGGKPKAATPDAGCPHPAGFTYTLAAGGTHCNLCGRNYGGAT